VVHVLLTREREGYYSAFAGDLAELASHRARPAIRRPSHARQRRAARKVGGGVPANRFLFALQNHDQVGNRAHGERLQVLSNTAAFRAATLLLSFLPATPLLFMGQEWRPVHRSCTSAITKATWASR